MPTMATVCPGSIAAALEDVAGAAERLARDGHVRQRRRQRHDGTRIGEVELGVGTVSERGDPVALGEGVDAFTQRRDRPPSLVSRRAGGWG